MTSLINRYYGSTTGQFISVDPDVNQTGQPYAYAGDDPVDQSDATGLNPAFGQEYSSCPVGEVGFSSSVASASQSLGNINVFALGTFGAPATWRWAQPKYGPTFSGGAFKGEEVESVIEGLRNGTIDPSELPVGIYDLNGTTYILNTRSSAALTEAGIPREEWSVVDETGSTDALSRLTNQLNNNQTPAGGFESTPEPANGGAVSLSDGTESDGFFEGCVRNFV